MPQIRCPNCGLTINLESRKELDIDLITSAVRGKAKTFTGLLHETRLPRKTLSLRLRELCGNDTLVKKDGVYLLNGAHYRKSKRGINIPRFSNTRLNGKMSSAVLLIALLMLGSPIAAHVLAGFFVSPTLQKPVIFGEFVMAVEIHDFIDLYAWQVIMTFNRSELEVLEVISGDFVGDSFPTFVYRVREDGLLLLAGTLVGRTAGKDGSGVLARIVFGYVVEEYQEPEIVPEKGAFRTVLFDSKGAQGIPIPIPTPDSVAFLKLVVEQP